MPREKVKGAVGNLGVTSLIGNIARDIAEAGPEENEDGDTSEIGMVTVTHQKLANGQENLFNVELELEENGERLDRDT